jgi:hypothetical protein
MNRPGHNHADRRLVASPRAYFANPSAFGTIRAGRLVMPADGNRTSQLVAAAQHRLVVAWLAWAPRGEAARLAARFEVSASTVSRIVRGHRWAGSVGMALLEVPVASGIPSGERREGQ